MRSTAIALVPRLHARHWPASVPGVEQSPKTARAQKLLTFLQVSGASFFDQMHESVGGLRCEVEDALAELAGLGLVTSDGFNGLRALIGEHKDTRLIGRNVGKGFDETGRWSLVPQWPEVSSATPESTEHIARVLLRRYGVVFWTVLEREMTWLPPWRELLAVIVAWRHAVKFAADGLSPDFLVNNSRCPRPLACCAKRGVILPQAR
jgi:ATP-dependent Lhr-like helicase